MIPLFCTSRAILHLRRINTTRTGTREAPSHILGHHYSSAAAAAVSFHRRRTHAANLLPKVGPCSRRRLTWTHPQSPNGSLSRRVGLVIRLERRRSVSSSLSEVNRKSNPAASTRDRKRARGHRLLPGDDIVSVLMVSLLLNPPKPPPCFLNNLDLKLGSP